MKPNFTIACVLLILFLAALSTQPLRATSGDDFNDSSTDTSKWGPTQNFGNGALSEKNQRLEYSCNTGTGEDDAIRPWILTRFPCSTNWEMQIDTFNLTTPTFVGQVDSFGLKLISPQTADNEIFIELYSSALSALPYRTGFASELETSTTNVATADSGSLGATNAAVRMVFNSTNKVITVFYDTNIVGGYQWVPLASYGLAGAGGTNGNTDWSLSSTGQFSAYVYGFSAHMGIPSGAMYGDNFKETGGVTPSDTPTPSLSPLGTFQFAFPSNNALLTRMVSISGHYQGLTPAASPRSYSVDVAQDESGKLAVLGTADGIKDKDGNSEISSSVGSIKTVKGKPTAQLKANFTGTRDGVDVTASAKASGIVELKDIGGGTNGFIGTSTYKGNLGGVPFSARNLPVQVAAPSDVVTNVHQDWNFTLDIKKQAIGKKEQTLASAMLVLPNGDTISYPAKKAKYSDTRGYTLSFRGGTNTTVNPPKIDKKSSIAVKNLTFVQQGSNWKPTGGVVTYRFLGQQGTAKVTDFLMTQP